jgi:hypothetical protein
MELTEIQQMIAKYKGALQRDLDARAQLAEETEGLERYTDGLLAMAYSDGTINGKNADARKRQEAQVIADDQDIHEIEFAIGQCAMEARNAEVERKAQEAMIGLVKAWLYSQSDIR